MDSISWLVILGLVLDYLIFIKGKNPGKNSEIESINEKANLDLIKSIWFSIISLVLLIGFFVGLPVFAVIILEKKLSVYTYVMITIGLIISLIIIIKPIIEFKNAKRTKL